MRKRKKLRWIERRQNNKSNWGSLPFNLFDTIILIMIIGLAVLVLRAAFIYSVIHSPPDKSLSSFGESSNMSSVFHISILVAGFLFCFWTIVTILRIDKLRRSFTLLVWHLAIFFSIGLLAFGSYSSVKFKPLMKYDTPMLTEDIRQAILHIEKDSVLPREASNKNRYERFYAKITSHDNPSLEAIYIIKNRHSKIWQSNLVDNKVVIYPYYDVFFVPERDLPRVNDGGCGVITLYYNLTTKTIDETKQVIVNTSTGETKDVIIHGYCNGHA